jgi:hypothetical protein
LANLTGNALAQLIRKRREPKRSSFLAAMFAFDGFSHTSLSPDFVKQTVSLRPHAATHRESSATDAN